MYIERHKQEGRGMDTQNRVSWVGRLNVWDRGISLGWLPCALSSQPGLLAYFMIMSTTISLLNPYRIGDIIIPV